MLFREAVIAFLGAGEAQQTPEDDYCQACRDLGEDDCDSCTREIEVIDSNA